MSEHVQEILDTSCKDAYFLSGDILRAERSYRFVDVFGHFAQIYAHTRDVDTHTSNRCMHASHIIHNIARPSSELRCLSPQRPNAHLRSFSPPMVCPADLIFGGWQLWVTVWLVGGCRIVCEGTPEPLR